MNDHYFFFLESPTLRFAVSNICVFFFRKKPQLLSMFVLFYDIFGVSQERGQITV